MENARWADFESFSILCYDIFLKKVDLIWLNIRSGTLETNYKQK